MGNQPKYHHRKSNGELFSLVLLTKHTMDWLPTVHHLFHQFVFILLLHNQNYQLITIYRIIISSQHRPLKDEYNQMENFWIRGPLSYYAYHCDDDGGRKLWWWWRDTQWSSNVWVKSAAGFSGHQDKLAAICHQLALAQKPSVVSIPEFKRLNVFKSNYFVPEMI